MYNIAEQLETSTKKITEIPTGLLQLKLSERPNN